MKKIALFKKSEFSVTFSLIKICSKTEAAERKEESVNSNRDLVVKRRDYLIKRQKELGLSNQEAAELLDVSLRYYARLIDGVRGRYLSASLMKRICKRFGFSGDTLLDLESDFQEQLMNIRKTT